MQSIYDGFNDPICKITGDAYRHTLAKERMTLKVKLQMYKEIQFVNRMIEKGQFKEPVPAGVQNRGLIQWKMLQS